MPVVLLPNGPKSWDRVTMRLPAALMEPTRGASFTDISPLHLTASMRVIKGTKAAGGCQDSREKKTRAGVSNLQLGPILGEQAMTKLAALLDGQSCILPCVEKCEHCKCRTCTKHVGFAAKRSGPLHNPRQIAHLLQT